MDEIKAIQRLIKAEIGLDEGALGVEVIRNAIENRLKATAHANQRGYVEILEQDPQERAALCQLLLISESWMLREPETLEAGKRYLQEIRATNQDASIRLLSAPCARGEEAVSLLHIALEAGFSLNKIEVVGIDLSEGALRLAQAGIFGRGSFRSSDPYFVQRYFVSEKNHYQLRPEYRERISFKRVNLLDNLANQLGGTFSLILCRNVLIYLGQEERDRVISNLREILPIGGFLGVGLAESSLFAVPLLNRRPDSLGSVFYHGYATTQVPAKRKAKNLSPRMRATTLGGAVMTSPQLPGAISRTTKDSLADMSKQEATLAHAFALADSGKHADAQETCFILIDRDPLQADAYYLLGLLAIAQNDTFLSDAYFKRALYLNPHHEEARLQLGYQKRVLRERLRFGVKRA